MRLQSEECLGLWKPMLRLYLKVSENFSRTLPVGIHFYLHAHLISDQIDITSEEVATGCERHHSQESLKHVSNGL